MRAGLRLPLLVLLLLLLAGAPACSTSPTSPDAPGASLVLQGQTVSAVDGTASPSLSVQIGRARAVTTDSQGHFEVEVGNPGLHRTVIRGSGIIERETSVSSPSSERARFSLIPASFDLTAFDEMFRTSGQRLQRWMARPALVVVASTMTYRAGPGDEYQATGEQMSDEEVNAMVAQLRSGLAMLTGQTFTNFAEVSVERPPSGSRVNIARTGSIVVGRYNGIVSLANTIGYGQWLDRGNGTVVGGSMFLDRDFDRNDSRRHLLRIHELGHALGYQHVRSRTSIMNPAVGPEPTEFDRIGASIAFQRPPGNRSPDIDPSASMSAATTGDGARWTKVLCDLQ